MTHTHDRPRASWLAPPAALSTRSTAILSTAILSVLSLLGCGGDGAASTPAGASGTSGEAGSGGAAGSSAGAAGAAGSAGASGMAGGSGTAGSGGMTGASGVAGASGTAGVSGAAGSAGSTSGLVLSGDAQLTSIDDDGFLHIDFGVFLDNEVGEPVTLSRAMTLIATPGGYSYDLATGLDPQGQYFQMGPSLDAGAQTGFDGWVYSWSTPVEHLVFRVDATGGSTQTYSATEAIPLVRDGYADVASLPVGDVYLGLQEPLEIVSLADGTRWLTAVGQLVHTTKASLSIGDPVAVRLLSPGGVEILSTTAPWVHPISGSMPIQHFLLNTEVPQDFQSGDLSFTVTVTSAGAPLPVSRQRPIRWVEGAKLAAPVQGRWLWGNGPAETTLHTHYRYPEQRFAYDLLILGDAGNGQSGSYMGDPGVNESYFCFDQPIRAAAAGIVVGVDDSVPDNLGNQLSPDNPDQKNAYVRLQHDGGLFTEYVHVRQHSALVAIGDHVDAGQEIAHVGNAGITTEPHLHFTAYKISDTGVPEPVPISLTALTTTDGTPCPGVPHGAVEYLSP